MDYQTKILGSKQGFTLVEVVVVSLIFAIVSIVIVALYLAQNRLTGNEVKVTDMQVRLTSAINTILPLFFEGNNILSSATVAGKTYTTDNNTIVMTIPSIDDNKFAIAGANDTIALDHTNSGDLELAVEANAASSRTTGTRVIFGDIDSVEIAYENSLDPTLSSWFDVTVTNNVQTSHDTKAVAVNYRVTLRNK